MSASEDELPDPVFETDLELVGIVAVADNGVIGREGEMPWHIPADLEHFKRTTMDHPVILGRVTYESIVDALGEPLPGRTSIVLTRSSDVDAEAFENVVVAGDAREALAAAERTAAERHGGTDRAFVAGGATIYDHWFPALDRLVVTEVHDDPVGDTRFPSWEREAWREIERDDRDGFAFVEYERIE